MKIINKIVQYIKGLNITEKILYTFLCILFVFLMNNAVSPLYKHNDYENLAGSDSPFVAGYNPVYGQPELVTLVREETYKKALLELAEKDSIQLAINLTDSSVSLYINGVKIHKSDIKQFDRDHLLNRISNMVYTKIFSHTLAVQSCFATIVKEPIVIREAPKDTLEAALNVWAPDTLIQNPAFLTLDLDYGIKVILEQDENKSFYDKWVRFIFYLNMESAKILDELLHFMSFRRQDYEPTIVIKLTANDLRAIYRALPDYPSVAVCL